MTLTNCWWLLIWLFTGGVFLALFFPKRQEVIGGKVEDRWNVFPSIILMIPYIIWAGFRTNGFGDTASYRLTFLDAPSQLGQLPEYLSIITKDKGFSVFTVILKSIIGNSDVLFFIIIATIQLMCIVYVCRKYSCNYWLSVFLFVASTDYMGWVHNGMRQFIAITIIFAATDLLLKKRFILLIAIVLLASTFHASSLFMIPVIFVVQGKAWNKKSIICILVCVAALFFVDRFTDILDSALSATQYSGMVSDWKEWQDDGTNPIRVLVYSIPMLLSLIGYKQIREIDDDLINIGVNFSILSSGVAIISMATSGIFIGRMVQTVNMIPLLILLPWELKNLFTTDSSKLVTLCAVIGYIAFFFYQMHFAWGLL